MRTVVIDGDVLVYKAGQNVEKPIQWNTWLWTLHADLDWGIFKLQEIVDEIVEGLQADAVVFALSDYDVPNWRLGIMPTYKANRVDGKRRPVIWKPLRDYIEDAWDTYIRPSMEGDDVAGILLTHPKLIKGEKVLVSIDKDMKTLPGKHLNLDHAHQLGGDMVDHVFTVDEEQAARFHMLQTLAGDAVDGYGGVPGVGMVRAERFLDAGLIQVPEERTITRGARKGQKETRWTDGPPGTPWEVVVSVYAAAGLPEYVALQNARVARILRYTDYDFKKKEVILWDPPRPPRPT